MMRDLSADVVLVGCGAIGLPLAVALATTGRRVLGVDINARKIDALQSGRLDMVEEGLESAFHAVVASGALRFATRPEIAIRHSRSFIVGVPTPADRHGFNGEALDDALVAIVEAAAPGDLVCIRSTVPIGTTRALAAKAPHLRFASCPDRSVAGRAYPEQFETPHLVGGVCAEGGVRAEALLTPLGSVVRVADPETAEAIKLFANVERDVTFALANQFALICDAAGVDFAEARRAGAEGFARFRLARAGPVGGPCLTKDSLVLAASPALSQVSLDLIQTARRLNESLVGRVAEAILARPVRGPLAILGLAFKGAPETRDLRFGFGGQLRDTLKAMAPGLEIRTWDPAFDPDPRLRDFALDGAVQVVLANDHPALCAGDLFERLGRDAVIYDMTGLLVGRAAPPGVTIRRWGDGSDGPTAATDQQAAPTAARRAVR